MTGSLAVQPFDILNEYASGLHASKCPSRFASARFRGEPSSIMPANDQTLTVSLNVVNEMGYLGMGDDSAETRRPASIKKAGLPMTQSHRVKTSGLGNDRLQDV
jgi:hypothetical protein